MKTSTRPKPLLRHLVTSAVSLQVVTSISPTARPSGSSTTTRSKLAAKAFRQLALRCKMPPRKAATKRPNAKPPSGHARVALALAATLFAACAGSTPESGRPDASGGLAIGEAGDATGNGLVAKVERVVDGDTLLVAVAGRTETVRLLGIDTPEKPGGPRPAECFGQEASNFAQSLLPTGTEVYLTRDIETRDQYGRLLAFVHRSSDDLFVNHAMVEHGYATALFFPPNRSAEVHFTKAADAARREWIGFWESCGAPDVLAEP